MNNNNNDKNNNNDDDGDVAECPLFLILDLHVLYIPCICIPAVVDAFDRREIDCPTLYLPSAVL